MWDLATLHHLNEEAVRRAPLQNAEVLKRVIAAIELGVNTTPATQAVIAWRDTQLAKASA